MKHGSKATLTLMSCAALLGGCIDQATSVRMSDPRDAITVAVVQPYFWKKEVKLEMVMSRLTECQRRFRFGAMLPSAVKVEVYQPPEGMFAEKIFIVHQGGINYALSPVYCEIQPFKETPKDLGQALGKFVFEGEKLVFKASPLPPALPKPAPDSSTQQ